MLRKTLIVTLAIISSSLLPLSSYALDVGAEEAMIREVIEDETDAWIVRDYDKWAKTWLHEPYVYRETIWPEGFNYTEGWEDLSTQMKNTFKEDPNPLTSKWVKTDFKYNIIGEVAFVSFLENGEMSTRVLEKRDGNWKIMRLSLIYSRDYESLANLRKLEILAGDWLADNSTIKVTPAPGNRRLNTVVTTIAFANGTLKIDSDFTLKTSTNSFTYHEEQTLAYDYDQGRMTALAVGGWKGSHSSEVHVGDCELLPDGKLQVKQYRLGEPEKLSFEMTLSHKQAEDVLHVEYTEYLDETAQVTTYDLVRSHSPEIHAVK
jgi:hypothetical protein